MWRKNFWTTYQLVNLAKAFPLSHPSVLISQVREVGSNLATSLSLQEFVMGHS